MKVDKRLLLLTLTTLSLAFACRGRSGVPDDSRLAEVSIHEVEGQDYKTYEFTLLRKDGTVHIPKTTYNRGKQKIDVKVPVGTYKIVLDYFKDQDKILSTAYCTGSDLNDEKTFVAGPNVVEVNICNKKAEVVTSTVVIKPILVDNDPSNPDPSTDAEFLIGALEFEGYKTFQFTLLREDGQTQISRKTYNRGAALEGKVPVGKYKFILDYFNDQDRVYSTSYCTGSYLKNVQTLTVGKNAVEVNICSKSSDVVTVPSNPTGNPPVASTSGTFSIQDGKLIDPSGKPFIMRGINMPFNYYFNDSFGAIEHTKTMGFNAVRVVWCADTIEVSGRCEKGDGSWTHMHSPATLDRVLTKLTDFRLVSILNLQNVTGRENIGDLQLMVDYLVRADIKPILMKHKRNLIINIANEWMGKSDQDSTWAATYKRAITKLREAGLPHVLVVDASGWGQNFNSIQDYAAEIMKTDKQILFSSHMYAVYQTEQFVLEKLDFIRSQKIPFIIGEFGCSHYNDGKLHPVACDAILKHTADRNYPIGTLAWSYAGNGGNEGDLDIFSKSDWRTLVPANAKLVTGPYGVQATGKQACFFQPELCR